MFIKAQSSIRLWSSQWEDDYAPVSDRAWSEMWLLILYWVWWGMIHLHPGSAAKWACGDWREAHDQYYAFRWGKNSQWWDNGHLVNVQIFFFCARAEPDISIMQFGSNQSNIQSKYLAVAYECFFLLSSFFYFFLMARHSETINTFHYEHNVGAAANAICNSPVPPVCAVITALAPTHRGQSAHAAAHSVARRTTWNRNRQ